jgi:hypothetical protein
MNIVLIAILILVVTYMMKDQNLVKYLNVVGNK